MTKKKKKEEDRDLNQDKRVLKRKKGRSDLIALRAE